MWNYQTSHCWRRCGRGAAVAVAAAVVAVVVVAGLDIEDLCCNGGAIVGVRETNTSGGRLDNGHVLRMETMK